MKVYLFFPSKKIMEYMNHTIDDDGVPFTTNKFVARMFDTQRNQNGEYEFVVRQMSRESYEKMHNEYWPMEIIMYHCIDDIHDPKRDEYPESELVSVPMLRIEKDAADEGFGSTIDSWPSENYIPDIDKFKTELRKALHSLGFCTFTYTNIAHMFNEEPNYEFNTNNWFADYGNYFDNPPF